MNKYQQKHSLVCDTFIEDPSMYIGAVLTPERIPDDDDAVWVRNEARMALGVPEG